jgi:preprotein translocase subunit SecG
METILFVLFVLVCICLIGVILLQKGRGGGLSGAFGGAGGHTAFGTRTGDMFTWVTVVLMGLFILFASLAVLRYRPAGMVANQQAAPAMPAVPQPEPTTASAPATGSMPADEAAVAVPPAPMAAPATLPVPQ